MDASVISCVLTLVTISVFLHINYLLKLITMVLTAIGHLAVYACLVAKNVDEDQIPERYININTYVNVI